MEYRRVLTATLVAAALSQMAQAHSAFSAQQLGATQGVLDFCSRVDAADDEIFDGHTHWLYEGWSAREIREVKSSKAFRDAYATLGHILAELPDGRARCHAIDPAPKNHVAHHEDDREDHELHHGG